MSNYPYNPYGYNPQQYQEQYSKMQQLNKQKRELRRRSTFIGLGIIIFVLIGFVMYYAFTAAFPKYKALYEDDIGFSICVDIILTVASLFGAYFIIRLLIDRQHKAFIPLALPQNRRHAALLVPFGIMMCITGGYLTMYLNDFIEKTFDITFTQPEIPDPETPIQLLLYLVSVALVPCIFEEIALRAGALEAMRKYGDRFAIVTSAFVFAILHGNMVQTPFAFIAGLAIGYIYVATGSIWPGVIIHFVNNLMSCLTTIGDVFGASDDMITVIYGAYIIISIVTGVTCFIIYLFDKKRPVLNKDTSNLTASQKMFCFFINAPMIISLLYMGYVTTLYIE